LKFKKLEIFILTFFKKSVLISLKIKHFKNINFTKMVYFEREI